MINKRQLSDEEKQQVSQMPELIRKMFLINHSLTGISVDDFEKKAADVLNKAFEK